MLSFIKYQGTGNDFIIIDQMKMQQNLSSSQVSALCNRHFGIGADGIMLLQPSSQADFKMVYYNSDGEESSMCGNGGRCIVHFAFKKGYIDKETHFEAVDGFHKAKVNPDETVSLQMSNVTSIGNDGEDSVLDTGSPHYVHFVENADNVNIITEGRAVRYNSLYSKEGINVNFAEMLSDGIYVRTYERGVEDETLSCGTGVTAAVIAASAAGRISNGSCEVVTRGGRLSVSFKKENDNYIDVWLHGPAEFVFKGEIDL